MRWLELRIPPLAVSLIFALAMFAVASLVPTLSFHAPSRVVIALLLAAVGALVAISGVVAFRRHGTTVNPLTPSASSSLVTSGVYGYSRNPMYLGVLLLLAAWAAYLSNVLAAVLLPGFVVYMNQFQIKPEEQALLCKFGAPFARYTSCVGRWL